MSEDASTLSDWQAIGDKGGTQAIALVGKLMQDSADHLATVQAKFYESMEADRDRWKARALAAEDQLDMVAARLHDLVMRPASPSERARLFGEMP